MVATAHAPLQEPTRMKESRTKKPSEGGSEISAWLSKSRKLEKKRASQQLSKIFEEQDKIAVCESDDKDTTQHTENLALHGFDEAMEGGSVVVLTIKDQPIIAEGDVNEEVDMLENVEIGEQKRRDEAYKATKKKTGACDDEFNDEEKKMLAQCDDVKVSSDYYTHEEMLKFKKPGKKKSLRKKDELDINALEAEAVSSGLGVGDLGSRNNVRRQGVKEERERLESEMRSNAYEYAYAKAEKASKLLREEKTLSVETEEDETPGFVDDDEDLRKCLEKARRLALEKHVGPGKLKQEKRMKQYQEESKMNLCGLTPMRIKRKVELSSSDNPKKPKS